MRVSMPALMFLCWVVGSFLLGAGIAVWGAFFRTRYPHEHDD